MKYRSSLAFTLITLLILTAQTVIAQRPYASKGVLNATEWNFAEGRLPLVGIWRWHDFQLLDPDQTALELGVAEEFPRLWNDVRVPQNGGTGYATYALDVLVPSSVEKFAIEMPQVYSAYKLWVNGKVVAENGVVGKDAEACLPQWRPQVVSFQGNTDTLSIVMQIANFHHSKGGCKEDIYLGESNMMLAKSKLDTMSAWVECCILLGLTAIFLVAFLRNRSKMAALYFALMCLSWSIRSIFSNRYVFISEFPDFDWTIMVQIEYSMLFLAMIWGTLFLDSMFKNEVNSIVKYVLIFISTSFLMTVIATTPIVFTRWLFVYLSVSGVLLLYGAFIVINAWINERVGSAWIATSVFWMIGIFAYDIFAYEGLFQYDALIFGVSYVLIYSLIGVALLYHLGVFKSTMPTTKLTFDDLMNMGK